MGFHFLLFQSRPWLSEMVDRVCNATNNYIVAVFNKVLDTVSKINMVKKDV